MTSLDSDKVDFFRLDKVQGHDVVKIRHNMILDLISATLIIKTSPILRGITIYSLSIPFY